LCFTVTTGPNSELLHRWPLVGSRLIWISWSGEALSSGLKGWISRALRIWAIPRFTRSVFLSASDQVCAERLYGRKVRSITIPYFNGQLWDTDSRGKSKSRVPAIQRNVGRMKGHMAQSVGTSKDSVSIASNATAADGLMLLRIVPHWLRVFGSRLSEIVIVVDSEPLEGRIAELQRGQSNPEQLQEAIRTLEASDQRVRFVSLGSINPTAIERRWFGKARPLRCQAGTPILAFVAAIEQARCNIVLRCDSDMLFCERGWLLEDALPSLQEGVDVYEPPRRLGSLRADFRYGDGYPVWPESQPARIAVVRFLHGTFLCLR